MTREEIGKRVKKVVAATLNRQEEEIKDENNFVDDLGADSLDQVELIMAFEEEFEVGIPDEDAQKLTTVGAVIEYITEKTANRRS